MGKVGSRSAGPTGLGPPLRVPIGAARTHLDHASYPVARQLADWVTFQITAPVLRAGPAPNPLNRSLPRTAPRPKGPRSPRRPPPSRRRPAPCLRARPHHDRYKPPIPPGSTADAARFWNKFGVLKTQCCRDLRRETGRLVRRGVGVFVNLKHPVIGGERSEVGVARGSRG